MLLTKLLEGISLGKGKPRNVKLSVQRLRIPVSWNRVGSMSVRKDSGSTATTLPKRHWNWVQPLW